MAEEVVLFSDWFAFGEIKKKKKMFSENIKYPPTRPPGFCNILATNSSIFPKFETYIYLGDQTNFTNISNEEISNEGWHHMEITLEYQNVIFPQPLLGLPQI